MQFHHNPAQISGFSTLDTFFAASVVMGFAFALLLVLSSGRVPRLRLFKASRGRPIRPIGRIPKSGKAAAWQTIPGAIPVGIGAFFIGFGLCGLALRGLLLSEPVRALAAGVFGTLFATLFLTFIARYFGGGAKEETGSALIGAVARVSLEIPADGAGKIAFERAGRRGTMPARSSDGRAMPSGTPAFVVAIDAGTALVEEL